MPRVRLSGDQSVRLKTALLAVFKNPGAFDEVLIPLERHFQHLEVAGQNYEENVLALVVRAATDDWLIELLAEVRKRVPSDTDLEAIQNELLPAAATAAIDHFDVCRLSGKYIMIDRARFRAALRDLVRPQGNRILVVKGEPRTGKTHSAQLVSYLRQARGDFRYVHYDLEVFTRIQGQTKPVEPLAFAERFVAKLDQPIAVPPAPGEEPWANWVVQFCDEFEKRFGAATESHWVVIDGFNKVLLAQATVDLIKEMARRIHSTLTDFRLILIGYGESFPDELLGLVEEEQIAPIGQVELLEFFEKAFRQLQIPFDEDKLVDTVDRLLDHVDLASPGYLDRLAPLAAKELIS